MVLGRSFYICMARAAGLSSAHMMYNYSRLYAISLMNSYRTETFNITDLGHFQSYFIQGGLRWMTVTLVTGDSLSISNAGIEGSFTYQDPSTLPGTFHASDTTFDEVWDLGARAVQASCFDAGTQNSTWDITPDGALIRYQQPPVSANGSSWDTYTLEFTTKIVSGGVGWKFASSQGSYGAYAVLTSNVPGYSILTMDPLPLNSLTVGYGFSLINIQVLPSASPQSFKDLPITIENDTWYTITTVITGSTWTISVNGTQLAAVDTSSFQSDAGNSWSTGSLSKGTIGFAPWYMQEAYYKDVTVTASDGTPLYSNDFTSEDTLYEYGVHTNNYAVCLDGPKRDRDVWIGDFAHTTRSIAFSSGKYDYIKSMLDLQYLYQEKSGQNLVPISSQLGMDPEHSIIDAKAMQWVSLGDYQFFHLLVFAEYFELTNDTDTVSKYWDQTKALVSTLSDTFIDPTTHLASNASTQWFLAQRDQSATAPTALFVYALRSLANVASVLGDTDTKTSYTSLAKTITDAINTQTWNGTAYGISTSRMDVISVPAVAMTILGGIATDQSSSGSISAMQSNIVNIGYRNDVDTGIDGNGVAQLSPNTQGFLLEAMFRAYLTLPITKDVVMPTITQLTKSFWPAMTKSGGQDKYYTGASWEYVNSDGSPGIGLFTSLGHPWGGAPTYIYSNYILGIRTEWNADINAYEWVFHPMYDVATDLGLTWVNGTVPLASGGYIEASWKADSSASSGYTSSVKVVNNNEILVADQSQPS